MTIRSDDLVRDIFLRLIDAVPGLDRALAADLERQVRADWGGCEYKVYIAKTRLEDRATREHQIAAAAQTMPVGEVSKKYGMSRRGVYKLLSRQRGG